MHNHNFPPFSTVIAPSYLHQSLRKQLTDESTGCIGIRLYTLQSYITSLSLQEQPSEIDILFTYKQAIETLSDVTNYGFIAKTASFLKECLTLIEHMKFHHVQISQLPQEDEAQEEAKRIIEVLYPINTTQDVLNQVMDTITDCSNVIILDGFYTYQEQCIIDHLLAHGAIFRPLKQRLATSEFYHAINPRQEIEAMAQYIIQHEIDASDIVVTLASSTYSPVVQQVFDRYQIPYTLLKNSTSSIMTQRFLHLLAYVQSGEISDFLACMDVGLFACETDALREYLELFPQDLHSSFDHLQNITCDGHILDTYGIQKLTALQQLAQQDRLRLQVQLLSLEVEDIQQLVTTMLDIVKESMNEPSLDEIQAYTNIQDIVSQCYPYVKERYDLEFLATFIKSVSIHHSPNVIQGAMIADLHQIFPDRDYQFLLGVTQKNYPGFRSEAGIFDEAYWKLTPLPDMETRYQHYSKQCDKALHANVNLIASYAVGTYEGKGNEAALEIEEALHITKENPSKPYPLIENYQRIDQHTRLSSEMAHALFVNDRSEIQGSISAIERYIHCPYAYFLRYGLGLREPMELGFDPAYMGTLAHHVLETIVKKYRKNYTQIAPEEIQAIVDHEVNEMCKVFPDNASMLQTISKRFMQSFHQTMKRLADFEEHSLFTPGEAEVAFEHVFPIDDAISLHLHGIIDRLDVETKYSCIFDYKSSAKTLSEDRVFSALQLQLITYAVVLANDSSIHRPVIGAYYISLKNQNIPYVAGKMKRRPVDFIESDHEQYEEEVVKAHRFNGWTMYRDISLLDDNGAHLVGVSMNKDGEVKARRYYQPATLKQQIESMYQIIGKRIISGDIALSPDADACLFCDYRPICRFKGMCSERKAIVETDPDTLYWEGGDVDVDME